MRGGSSLKNFQHNTYFIFGRITQLQEKDEWSAGLLWRQHLAGGFVAIEWKSAGKMPAPQNLLFNN
jgi:hypothetical protein